MTFFSPFVTSSPLLRSANSASRASDPEGLEFRSNRPAGRTGGGGGGGGPPAAGGGPPAPAPLGDDP